MPRWNLYSESDDISPLRLTKNASGVEKTISINSRIHAKIYHSLHVGIHHYHNLDLNTEDKVKNLGTQFVVRLPSKSIHTNLEFNVVYVFSILFHLLDLVRFFKFIG